MKFKNLNPDNLAIIDSFLVSLVYVIAYLTVSFLWFDFRFLPLLISAPVVFIINYLIIEYSFRTFIYKRIKLIYKVIGEKTKDVGEQHDSKNLFDDVEEVVFKWSETKNKEIEELKKMAAYRREFLGNVSHELKTPIFNIQGYVSTLLDGGLEDDKVNRKFLKKTNRSVDRLIRIVTDLEQISKLESGELKLNLETFDLYKLVEEVADFMELKAEKGGAKILITPENRSEFYVYADRESIKEVLINLIDNAVKYGDRHNNKVTIGLYDMDEKVVVEVADNGPGIPQEYLPRVFERFFRTDKARSRKKGGTGLGLAIVKHIIEAHNQTVTVKSDVGKGTTFSFTLEKRK